MLLQDTSIAVAFVDELYRQQAEDLAGTLQITCMPEPCSADAVEGIEYVLFYSESGLGVQQTGKNTSGLVQVDFASNKLRHRRKSGHNELVGRACGVKAAFIPCIVDATAGLGQDSFVLADSGCEVLMLERSPIVAALLADGLQRAAANEDAHLLDTMTRLQLVEQDSFSYLQTLLEGGVDVVYLDPMFPERNKSAKVKKEMQLFHQLVGVPDGDPTEEQMLLAEARRVAKYRVVVKRPPKAPVLAGQKPNFELKSKAVRFDVYTKLKLPV